jgi:hypothetical protein
MAKRPHYTSSELIEAVKRKISMPITQVTFSNDEILDFANEELFLAQVPSIMQYHEEYLVYRQTIPLVAGINKYDIPDRAIGMKLRDLFYKDSNGNLSEMSNSGSTNQDYFQQNTFGTNIPRFFYVENNSIVLTSDIPAGAMGSLEMTYYLRPNSLVPNDRAAICTHFVKRITVNGEPLVTGSILKINGEQIIIPAEWEPGVPSGVSTSTDANRINQLINNLNIDGLSSVVSASTITLRYEVRLMEVSTNSPGLTVSSRLGIECNSIPSHFTERMMVDFLQTSGGHKTYIFDLRIPTGSISGSTIFFDDSVVPSEFKLGDYICQQYECIIPQVPSDLHNLLAERTCARILEALGDQAGLQTANTKIAELEQRQSTIINNRVEGAPKKIFARHSLLRYGKRRRSRGGSF